jgi:hypothetical protein
MRGFYTHFLMLTAGLLIGMIFTERKHALSQRDAEAASLNDPHFRKMQLDTQLKRALNPEFDQIMRDIEEKFGHDQ